MARIQLIFANYHCARQIADCVRPMLEHAHPVGIEVVIVNNGGEDFDATALPSSSGVRLVSVTPGSNAGYFGALRTALKMTTRPGLHYRILCNPDLEFDARDFFARLAALTLPARCAVLAPSVVSTQTGRDQNPYLRQVPSVSLRRRWRWVYANRLNYQINDWASALRAMLHARKDGELASAPAAGSAIHAPHGAMMIFTEAFLQRAPDFDRVPFLYAEELFIGEICRRGRWTVWYEPTLKVLHREHATTGLLASSRRFALQREAMRAYELFASTPIDTTTLARRGSLE